MNSLGWLNPGDVGVELDPRLLRVLHRETVREWPLERTPAGELTPECRARVLAELAAWLGRRPWQPRLNAHCLLPGAGVSLRRWKLPRATAAADLPGVLRLQIESEFPMSPEDLAWGWQVLGEYGSTREILVAAVKRTVVDEFAALLTEAGLTPSFGLAALARLALCPPSPAGCAVLEIGRDQSELLVVDEIGPVRLRLLAWGEEQLVREFTDRLGLTREAATDLLARLTTGGSEVVSLPGLTPAIEAAVAALVPLLQAARPGSGTRLYLTGRDAVCPAFCTALGRAIGGTNSFEVLDRAAAAGPSSSLNGLRRLAPTGRLEELLRLKTATAEPASVLARPAPRQWALVAGALLLALLALPYAEALLLQPGLAAKVAAVKAKQDQLKIIDRESDFLRYLKQSQTAHLDTLLVIGKCAPAGARVDSLNLNRKGELSLRISMRQPPEVIDFRNKLVDCGFFSSVVVEEQSPTPDRQKLLVRISAQLKPAAGREGLKILSTNEVAGGRPGGPGGPPGMPGTPMGMPPGMPMPMPMP